MTDPKKEHPVMGAPTFAICTGHPDCEGESLIENHDTECPDGNGDDCENDTCWRGCPYCTTEDALN